MSDYDPKFHIDNLNATSNEILERLQKLESAYDSLFEAILKIAQKTNTFNGEIEAKLKEASQLRNN